MPITAFPPDGSIKVYPREVFSGAQSITLSSSGRKLPSLESAKTIFASMDRPEDTIPHHLLHITARLGLPLYICHWKMAKPLYDDDEDENWILRDFSRQPNLDEHSAKFLRETLKSNLRPTILLGRADGKALESGHVAALWGFIDQELRSSGGETEGFWKKMTPRKFAEFWRGGYGTWGYGEDMPCPVTLGCQGCGKDEGHLKECGRCGVVKYCGRECQVEHWAEHKKVCKRELKETMAVG